MLNKYLFTSVFEHLLWVKNCTMFWENNKEIKQTAHIEPMVITHDLTINNLSVRREKVMALLILEAH